MCDEKTGSSSDYWLYFSIDYSLLITINTALSPIYAIHSSPLRKHYDSQFPLVVS
jgi:hypothetical protein